MTDNPYQSPQADNEAKTQPANKKSATWFGVLLTAFGLLLLLIFLLRLVR